MTDIARLGVVEASALLARRGVSATELAEALLSRIREVDGVHSHEGDPASINAWVRIYEEDALASAARADDRLSESGVRREGAAPALTGVPIGLKDLYGVAGRPLTASSRLLQDVPAEDCDVWRRLSVAGMVLLGHLHTHEFAAGGTTDQVGSPWGLERSAGGSSGGSAAALASRTTPAATGTDTAGSLRIPSACCGTSALKPTRGLVSNAGIVPLAWSLDHAGPMARSVADAAALLTAMAGTDLRDDATRDASPKASDYTKHLDANALKGARLGVVRSQFGGRNDLVSAEVEKALKVLEAQGAVLVDIPELPNAGKYGATELEVMLTELKAGMEAYLKEWAPDAPVRTLADIIAFNEAHKDKVMPYFGQEHFLNAAKKGGLDSKEYLDALAANHRLLRGEGIDKVLGENKLDALIAPTTGPAWITDFIKGDASGGSFSSPAAVAGYPHVTVPAGFVQGLPCGISFVGAAWSESRLIALAYAFEQASKARKPPTFPKTVNGW